MAWPRGNGIFKPHRWPLAPQLIASLALGCGAGLVFGPKVGPLGHVGFAVIALLKFLATPLIFLAIVETFVTTHIPSHRGAKLIFFSTINALVALVIALTVVNLIPVAKYVNIELLGKLMGASYPGAVPPQVRLTRGSLLESLAPGSVLFTVFIAVSVGVTFRFFKSRADKGRFKLNREIRAFERLIRTSLAIVMKILSYAVRLVPLAVFSVIAKVVGTSGFSSFVALALFVGIVVAGLFVHVFIYYSFLLKVVARKSPLIFFKQASPALLTALGTGSSVATLPVTLKILDREMKISTSSARLAACVGTNLNHDGILLYEAVAALFVAQIQSITLTLHQQLVLGLTSVLAAVGIAGVPDAGLITLSLVLGSVGLPLTAVPFLLPVDWFIGRLRAATNVSSDMIVATLLDRS